MLISKYDSCTFFICLYSDDPRQTKLQIEHWSSKGYTYCRKKNIESFGNHPFFFLSVWQKKIFRPLKFFIYWAHSTVVFFSVANNGLLTCGYVMFLADSYIVYRI